ncbi:F-BAR domain only protein 2-like isoform X2 [Tubulanus polymorphus]|uniref:F-BAR domain only protein 2-like isoform X2 n=1 Tax=Tubulanus polymorphus TaxID=672921 RepID=UPI003DA4C10A
MTIFSENFWGEKNNGFDVLYHNMKYGHKSSLEFADFLRESCSIEENYSRLLSKLAKQTGNFSQLGTFSTFWPILRTLVEKLSSLHLQLVHRWQDLLKDVHRYSEDQHKRHKLLKESSTLETVQSIQQITAGLHKSKEIYNVRGNELERLKRENAQQKDLEKAEAKFKKATDEYKYYVEKYGNVRDDFERKMTESCKHFQEEEETHLQQMKDFVDTYTKAWEQGFEALGQQEFQKNGSELTVEQIIATFVESKATGTQKPGPVTFQEFEASTAASGSGNEGTPQEVKKERRESVSVDKQRKEGDEVPINTNNEYNWNKLSPFIERSRSPAGLRGSRWFLSKGKKEKEKKKKKKKSDKDKEESESPIQNDPCLFEPVDPNMNTSTALSYATCTCTFPAWAHSNPILMRNIAKYVCRHHISRDVNSLERATPTPMVDDEGYSIRPDDPLNYGTQDSSSSDSESDADSDKLRKIKVEIKPLSPNGSSTSTSNVDDIRASFEGLKLSPVGGRRRSVSNSSSDANNMKRSVSVSDTIHAAKPSQDLLGTSQTMSNLFASSSASTPTGGNYSFPSSLFPSCSNHSGFSSNAGSEASTPVSSTPVSTPGPYLDNYENDNDTPPALPAKQHRNGLSGSSPVLLPGPPPKTASRTKLTTRGRQSPITNMSRNDSQGSLSSITFNTTSVPIGSSRGPSPLTIGMSDTIPLAVAYTETINAIFKGSNHSKCLVRLSGDMKMSFPQGIVRVLTENPSPAQLTFRMKNMNRLESLVTNKNLITEDTRQSTSDSRMFLFHMTALIDHLRTQADQHKNASYYNVDILKYQVKPLPEAQSTPLHITPYWKCEASHTDFKLDYSYNGAALSNPMPLCNVNILVPVNGDATSLQSLPAGFWSKDKQRATWKLDSVSDMNENGGQGCIRAKFEVAAGPSTPQNVAVQFLCEGSTISGIDFELVGPGYRLSLAKRRLSSGKYFAEPDSEIQYV